MSKTAVRVLMGVLAVGLAMGVGMAKDPAKEAKDAKEAAAVETEIATGLKAFKAGKLHDAIKHLQKAISRIQEMLGGDLVQYFPKAPKGWEAGEIKKQSQSATGTTTSTITHITRTYVRTKDKLRVDIALTNSPQMLKGQRAAAKAFENPMVLRMMNQDPNKRFTRINRDGWVGWSVVEKGRRAEANAFTETCLLTIRVSKAAADVLEMFLKSMDLKGLAKVLDAAAHGG